MLELLINKVPWNYIAFMLNYCVKPCFLLGIKAGGPLTVTHKDIERYFMTIPESVSYILQSAVYACGGEIFVLDMGQPVKIKHLAEKMIQLAGLKPYKDIDIIFTGLSPSKKLYEELPVDLSKTITTDNGKIFIEKETETDCSVFNLKQYHEITNNYEHLEGKSLKESLAVVISSYSLNSK